MITSRRDHRESAGSLGWSSFQENEPVRPIRLFANQFPIMNWCRMGLRHLVKISLFSSFMVPGLCPGSNDLRCRSVALLPLARCQCFRLGFRPRYMLVAASLSKVTSKAESATWKNREGILKRFGYILFYFIIFESNSHVLAQICLRFCIDFGQAVVS